eukprot:1159863-Pelagomonas_calceolata.AAC.6
MASLMCGWMDALDNDLEGDGGTNGVQQQAVEGKGRQERNEFGFLKVRTCSTPSLAHNISPARGRGHKIII